MDFEYYSKNDFKKISAVLNVDQADLKRFINDALRSEKHSEFHILAEKLKLDKHLIIATFSRYVISYETQIFAEIITFIKRFLE